MKKIWILLPVLLLYTLFPAASFAHYSMGDIPVKAGINLMGTRIPFSNAPFILDGEIMAPAREFQEKIGAQVSWNDPNREMISYKDNIFLKLLQNNSYAELNGKKMSTKVPIVFYKGELFAPAVFLAQSYEMSYTREPYRLDVAFREVHPDTMRIGYDDYRKFSFPDLGISIFMPDYYEVSADRGVYRFSNLHDPARAEIRATAVASDTSIREILQGHVEKIRSEGGQIDSVSTHKIGTYVCEVILSRNMSGELCRDYLYLVRGMAYLFSARNMTETTSENIAGTLSIDNYTLNENLEHYMELPGYNRYGVRFQQPIYSNMIVRNQILLSGTLSGSIPAKELIVTVSKGAQRFEYPLLVKDGRFAGTIYIPFGIGKHNISIYARESDSDTDILGDISRTVLKFSVLNESPESTADLVPTDLLDYDQNAIFNLLNSIGYTGINQYRTAKNLYDWMIRHYYIDFEAEGAPRKLSDLVLYDVTMIQPIEACVAYTGLLRASGIPARFTSYAAVPSPDSPQTEPRRSEFAVEAYVNGVWYRMGIVEDIASGFADNFMRPLTPSSKTGR